MLPRVPAVRLLLLVLLLATRASAQSAGDAPLLDQIEVELIGRDLVAFGTDGGDVRERLHLNERVRWRHSRGALGIVLTDERMLAVGTASASWQERRWERGEVPPTQAGLGDRVGLVVTNRRAVGFNGPSSALVEYRIGPQEAVQASGVGDQVAVVVTSRKAIGLSPVVDRFQTQDLGVHERLERVSAGSTLATVRTSRRVLVFRAGTASWGERRREIHED